MTDSLLVSGFVLVAVAGIYSAFTRSDGDLALKVKADRNQFTVPTSDFLTQSCICS
jgi:hypothetical protein